MSLDWLSWSNPVALWWMFLVAVSAINVTLWLKLRGRYGSALRDPVFLLSAAYVFGCAFRAILPRADVQRICLFDSWLSSVLIGRSVATVAELCFALQWALILNEMGRVAHSDTAKNIARLIVPLILLAECFSWYAVISTNFLGNVVENSLWTVTFALIAIALIRLAGSFRSIAQWTIAAMAGGVIAYVAFMATIDVPMYAARWQADVASGKPLLGLFAGLHELATHWVVTYDFTQWRHEIPWMSLYFSVAVWTSLALGAFGLVRQRLPRYRVGRLLRNATRRPLAIPVRPT